MKQFYFLDLLIMKFSWNFSVNVRLTLIGKKKLKEAAENVREKNSNEC